MTRQRLSRVFASAFAGLPALAVALASAPHLALADDDGSPTPDPGVARVSIAQGVVDVKRGDSGDTVAAAVNAPLSPGDYVSTQDDSRAEVEFDYGTELRIAADTQLRFTQLDPQDHELQLAAGTVDLRLSRGTGAHVQIQTPQATIQPDENGSYLVDVDADGNARITARSGSVDVITQTGTQTVVPGTTLAVSGDVDHPQFRTLETVAYAGFDGWLAERDRTVERVADNRYVDAGMVGAGDLDDNGRWIENPQYGRVWVPAVAAGWAPYRDGRWVWEPYYGWTWVDNEPWGWAPFHYGNWFYDAGTGWAWYPGAYSVERRYTYRPALVAFFNFGGGGDGMSLAFGNVGWVPIAPFEPFHPWWGGNGRGYGGYGYGGTTIVNNTTIVNTYTNVTVVNYRNARAPGGFAGVANGNFASGNFTTIRTLDPIEIRRAEPIRGIVPIVPTPNNLSFREHESGIRPLAPVGRFETFRNARRIAGPTFAELQARTQSVAIHAYPHQADAIDRIAPARFEEGASHPGYASPEHQPADSPRAIEPRYARPDTQSPARTNDPFERFGRPTTSTEPQESRPGGASPAYRAPYREAPVYRAPAVTNGGTPASPARPAYRAPSDRYPAYRTYRTTGTRVPHPAATHRAVKHEADTQSDRPQDARRDGS